MSPFDGDTTDPGARVETWADGSCAWQATALAAYALDVCAGGVQLGAELAARVHALTTCTLLDGAITVDCDARRATATLDGMVFQLQGRALVLLRPCAHCGTGRFASPPLSSRTDLGYALSAWQPYHSGCEPQDPADADW